MNRFSLLLLLATLVCATPGAARPALAIDWILAPSTFTHDPQSGARVSQYAPIGPVYVYHNPNFTRSGFAYNTSINRVRGSADRLHVVEQWGQPVRPYGEWQFPYRPYSVPYDLWGPPFGGLGWGGGGWVGPQPGWPGGPWQGGPWQGGPWQGGPWQGGPWQGIQPPGAPWRPGLPGHPGHPPGPPPPPMPPNAASGPIGPWLGEQGDT